jgi:SAM-dependent methyltransferase
MGLLAKIVEKVSDHPVLFIMVRGILENDFKAIRALIGKDLKVGQGLRTLDLGCGPGAFSDVFEGDDYVGIDLNARYIDHARRTRKGAFLVGDARKVELPDARFDQVLIFGLLHHLPDEDVRAVLGECRRLLAPGGRILAIEDIPAISRLNLIGHLIHQVENGEHIRPVDDYRRLYGEAARVERDEILQSGICDYYAAVLVTSQDPGKGPTPAPAPEKAR